ncbi:hypothetical protein [Vibrio astriarenae]|uniref:hypothetical protein n=1 Tax=Vibrio astriarenae TaxID=1481923 RepID=UPI003735CF34
MEKLAKEAQETLDRVANFQDTQKAIIDGVYNQQKEQIQSLGLHDQISQMQSSMDTFFAGMHANLQGAVDGLKQNLDEYERNNNSDKPDE